MKKIKLLMLTAGIGATGMICASEVPSAKSKLDMKPVKLSGLTQKKVEQDTELQKAKKAYADAVAEVDKTQKKVTRVDTQVNKDKNRLLTLTTEHDRMAKEITDLRARVRDSKAEKELVEKMVSNQEKTVLELKINAAKASVDAAEKKSATLTAVQALNVTKRNHRKLKGGKNWSTTLTGGFMVDSDDSEDDAEWKNVNDAADTTELVPQNKPATNDKLTETKI